MNAEPTLRPPPALPSPTSQNQPIQESPRGHHLWLLWLVVVCVLGAVVALVAYRLHTAKTQAGRAARGNDSIPVDVATARHGSLPIYAVGLPGTVTPLQTVTIHSRVDGQLLKIGFTEGRIVKQGDMLAQIDPGPFNAALLTAQGQLARDQAMLKNAQLDLTRFKQAAMAYTQQQIDTQVALVEQNAGVVKADQGAVDSANVNLQYCTITAPVTGLVGIRQVDVGNIVHAADTNGIVVITQLQPITVVFTIPQNLIPDVIKSGEVPPLQATALDGDQEIATGKLIAADSQVDNTSGTVKLRAEFDNKNFELFPNQLVNMKLLVSTLKKVVLIPAEAMQTGPDFSFVYVVKPDNTVDIRKIEPGPDAIVNDQDMLSVTSGLAAGDVVVTNGVDKLQAGSKIDATRHGTTRPTSRSSTSKPSKGGHIRSSLTSDSTPQSSGGDQ
jgi:multidrug efflux system membrane fusion protein